MLRLGSTGLFICGSRERPRLSRREAEQLLRRCLPDQYIILGLRALLGRVASEPVNDLSDERVLEELAVRIENGELLLFGELRPLAAGGGGQKTESSTSAPPPAKAPRTAAQQPATRSDPSLFPDNTDLAAMAAAMQGASKTGAPFCAH